MSHSWNVVIRQINSSQSLKIGKWFGWNFSYEILFQASKQYKTFFEMTQKKRKKKALTIPLYLRAMQSVQLSNSFHDNPQFHQHIGMDVGTRLSLHIRLVHFQSNLEHKNFMSYTKRVIYAFDPHLKEHNRSSFILQFSIIFHSIVYIIDPENNCLFTLYV